MKEKTFQVKLGLFLLLINFALLYYFENLTNESIAKTIQWGITFFLLIFVLCSIALQQKKLSKIWTQTNKSFGTPPTMLLNNFQIPVIIINNEKEVLWYNYKFKDRLLPQNEIYGKTIIDLIPQIKDIDLKKVQRLSVNLFNKKYFLYISKISNNAKPDSEIFSICLFDISKYCELQNVYENEKTVIAIIVVDNYDAIIQKSNELERGRIESEIEYKIKSLFENIEGIAQKIEKDKFLAIFNNKQLMALRNNKFLILDQIKNLKFSCNISPTISMGISNVNSNNLSQKIQEAYKSLDMALGRGGDQVALKTPESYIFFGGLGADIEQKSSVKIRIIASAFRNLIIKSENVLIMGHKFADFDCFGAAIGVARIAMSFNKTVKIAINDNTSMVNGLTDKFLKAEIYQDIIADFTDVKDFITESTLLVLVDVHSTKLIEYPEFLEKTKNIIVIDHHRKMVDYIENVLLFYHEPFSSSTCEMVTEIIRYLSEHIRLNKLEADALLSGIVLDTKNFVLRTGIRTFNAAALLKDFGADTIEIKKMFTTTVEEYKIISKIVSEAKLFKNYAICVAVGNNIASRLVIAKAADFLMEIKGVDASFVIYETREGCLISARSFGKVNVQIIMEALGGGGHRIMAAAQVKGKNAQEIIIMLKNELNKI